MSPTLSPGQSFSIRQNTVTFPLNVFCETTEERGKTAEKSLPVAAGLILERPEEWHLQEVYHLKHENKMILHY